MPRRGAWLAGIAATALCAVALACGDFGSDLAATPDASADTTTSSSSSSGTTSPPGDAGSEASLGSADAGSCFDFTAPGTLAVFETLGKVTQTDAGVVFKVDPTNADNGIRKNFHLAGGITSSSIGLDVAIEKEGSFHNGDEYTDIMNLQYGVNFAHTAFELQTNGLDVNIWQSESYAMDHYTYGLIPFVNLPFGLKRDFVRFDTLWGNDGSHNVSTSLGGQKISANTAESRREDLTMLIGGRRNGGNPMKLTFTLSKLCVEVR